MDLEESEILRYSRQILLKEVGGTGQVRIKSGKILVVGAGGLGSPAALYLAAAGVGTIGLIDPDNVDESNLQRQILHFTGDTGRPKIDSAVDKITRLNPLVRTVGYRERLDSTNASEILGDYDFVIDGTDNFASKFLINDACVLNRKPFTHAGILRFKGQTITWTPGHACYRCLFPEPPPEGAVPSCSQAGVIGAVAGVLGSIQAAEALKFLIGMDGLLLDSLLTIDLGGMEFRKIPVGRNPRCGICGEKPVIRELKDYAQPACALPGRSS